MMSDSKSTPKARKPKSTSQPRRGSDSQTKKEVFSYADQTNQRSVTKSPSISVTYARGSSTSRLNHKGSLNREAFKSLDSSSDLLSDPILVSKLKSLVRETFVSEISHKVAEKTGEVALLAGDLAAQVTKLVVQVSNLELALQQKSTNEQAMKVRISALEESLNELQLSTSPQIGERETMSEQRQHETYLDEMERSMLKQVNNVLEQRHSSLPRNFEAHDRTSRTSFKGLFGLHRKSRKSDAVLSTLRLQDLLGRWHEDGGDGTYWIVRSDGSAVSDAGMKLVLKERGEHGIWTVDRSDDWTLDVSSDPLCRLQWRGRGTHTNFLQSWKRYQVPEVSFFVESPAQREEDETKEEGGFHVAGVAQVTEATEEEKKDVVTRQRKASRPSSLKFFKVMRKGVLPKVLAQQLLTGAQIIEPKITALLAEIAHDAEGELVGLDYRFKTLESLEFKIGRDVHDANLKILEDMEKRRTLISGTHPTERSGNKHQKMLHAAGLALLSARRRGSKEREEEARKNQEEADNATALEAKKIEEEVMRIETQAEAEGKNEVDIAGLVWDISDALRYTMLVKTEYYTDTVRSALAKLEGAGMKPASLKNYWGEGDGYQGINDVFLVPSELSPNGMIKFEIQFHTPESFGHKMAVHGKYEEFRSTHDPTRKVELWQESVAMADTIPVPKDVLSLPVLKTQPMPIENTLYVDLVLSRALKIQQQALDAVNKVCSGIKLTGILRDEMVSATVTSTLMSPSAVEKRLISEMARGRRAISAHARAREEGGGGVVDIGLKEAALQIKDALVINVSIESKNYSRAVEKLLATLFVKSEFTEVVSSCAWAHPLFFERTGPNGGVGIYSHVTMEGEDDGVAFTPDDAYPLIIAFHTPESQTARIGLQAAWSEYRAANTSKQRQAALTRARRLVAAVSSPKGAKTVLAHRWMHEKGRGISGMVLGSMHEMYDSVGSSL